jgi:hypothetical protein
MYISSYKIILILILIPSILIVSGCANKKRNPLPLDHVMDAQVLSTKGIRTWGGQLSPEFQHDLENSVRADLEQLSKNPDAIISYSALLLSGGGAYGAFGAGFLNGWTSSKTRPEFKIVTGISTGALIAPLAFLGSDYDQILKDMYTGVSTEDIAEIRGLGAIWSDSLADPSPLKQIIATYINDDFIKKVAEAHNNGRRLYIGTTNLDAQRLSIWNMGAIANIDNPEARELFRKIMLASSSIPIFFPPVMIDVELDGKPYDEMHFDGGVITQVFFHLAVLNIEKVRNELLDQSIPWEKGKIFLIRNDTVSSIPDQIDRNIMDITERTVVTLIKASAINDLWRIYKISKKEGIDFYYTSIPEDFEFTATEPFDRLEMIDLYYLGYKIGSSNNNWRQTLPVLESD